MITVASYNIRKAIGADRRRRPDRILDVLLEMNADIVALQEIDRRFGARLAALPPAMIAERTHYVPVPFDMRPGSLGWHGNGILVRRGIEVTAMRALTLPMLEPRGAVMAELEVEGRPLRVIGMHLDLSGLFRRRQARAIMEILTGCKVMPTVMMGDLNEWRADRGCLADFGGGYDFAATGQSFPARRPLARLDRIIVSRDLGVEAAGSHHSALARIASDHLPVWARMSFRA
ncbi:endonuclease/exonuclease/phosphatase family protein [Sphingomonas sp. ID0503]|uniref:endonuclease/exonuclease/phosphatase family protein n=1 Tax=Sphingomonas sp. ID0503 TaxID=3399691 RepID=UPI003AFB45A0